MIIFHDVVKRFEIGLLRNDDKKTLENGLPIGKQNWRPLLCFAPGSCSSLLESFQFAQIEH